MPAILCKCNVRLSYGEMPCPIEWLFISDNNYDEYQGEVNAEELYLNMKSMLKCPHCERLWFFWKDYGSEPTCYEKVEELDSNEDE